MTAPHIVDPAGLLGEALSEASPDLMRNLLQTVINTLLSADADAVVGVLAAAVLLVAAAVRLAETGDGPRRWTAGAVAVASGGAAGLIKTFRSLIN